jgi:hypothetical protein
MKFVSILLISSLILVSCASSTRIKKLPLHQKYEKEINYLGENRSGTIILKSEENIHTEKVKVLNDSLYYFTTPESKQEVISLGEIKEIKFKDHTIGFFYGLVGGLGAGVGLGYVSIDWDGEMAGMGMLLYMGVGILVGSVYGGITGADLNYIIDNQGK